MTATPTPAPAALLTVRDLRIAFGAPGGAVTNVVDGVSFEVRAGEVACLVGQSGCGKTATARAVLAVLDGTPGVIGGQVSHQSPEGHRVDLYPEALAAAPLSPATPRFFARAARIRREAEARFAPLRGRSAFAIFQNSQTALSPFASVGLALDRAAALGGRSVPTDRASRRARNEGLLAAVGFEHPARFLDKLPSELSGGEAKRVALAQALAADARLIVADEPTTGLDPTLRVVLRDLFVQLASQGRAILLITHGLGLFHRLAHTVHVMQAGRIVESAAAAAFFGDPGPTHAYSRRLLAAEAFVEAP
ncbi:ATP-binding cassette domain-containing protein [Myxococcota bacterium]|nr:ATP-binding cassette domain-containing protein [Myxococcota bacterium]